MSIAAGEIGKQAVEQFSKTGGDATNRGGFDMPGERASFDSRDIASNDAGRPGAGFDGPWDNQLSASEKTHEATFEGASNNASSSSAEIGKESKETKIQETVETENIKGGAYKDIPSRQGYERHHMPADSVSEIARDDGPCIQMEKEDHRQTASFGNSREAREYRAQQAELIKDGKLNEAFQMDVDDVRSKFGGKYDDAISQAKNHLDQIA